MSAPQPAARRGRKLVLIVVCLVCVGAGAAVPLVVSVPPIFAKGKAEKKPAPSKHTVIVPFGEVVVNLAEERMTRYLRLKLAVVTDAEAEKDVLERVAKKKAAVKSRLIAHLAGKTLKDVSGTAGVNRLQREALEKFEDVLYPEGDSRLRDVVFEECVVQ